MISTNDLVLVWIMPAPMDLEIARLLGWYHIPLRTAPKVVSVDNLAFYQPGSSAERAGRFDFAAPARGHELATRAELLKDEADPTRASEEYYNLQIGPLERLSRPILADKWRQLTFLYTTGDYLLKAQNINDLVIHSDDRAPLWQPLRERADKTQGYNTDMPDDIEPAVLLGLLGIVGLQGKYELEEAEW